MLSPAYRHGGLSPDGRWVATGGWDKKVILFKAETGEPIAEQTHAGNLTKVRFSNDNRVWWVYGVPARTLCKTCPAGLPSHSRPIKSLPPATLVILPGLFEICWRKILCLNASSKQKPAQRSNAKVGFEAALRMLCNNLDPDVAENPAELVVYGGRGRAARNWEAFDNIVATSKPSTMMKAFGAIW